MKDPRSVAIVSSGDPQKDQEDIQRFLIQDDRIEQGLCPNGCGGMGEVDPYNAICLKCGFMLFQAGGLDFKKGVPN